MTQRATLATLLAVMLVLGDTIATAQTEAKPTMRMIESNGIKMRIAEIGKGPQIRPHPHHDEEDRYERLDQRMKEVLD